MKTATLSFTELFDFPPISAGITKDFIRKNQGEIPVYGSRKDGKPIGYIAEIPKIRFFENCLGWNRNGSVGYVFFHSHKFTTTDDHRPLCLKQKYLNILDMNFLRQAVQDKIFANGFAWGNKAGVDKLKALYLDIPIKNDGSFDLNTQKQIAIQTEKILNLQTYLSNILDIVENSTIKLDENNINKTKEKPLSEIFDFFKGKAKYTQKYFLSHYGKYPVYSSQTKNDGKIASIDTYDFDSGESKWLTWTTDGIYAGRVFVRQGKFSMTTHCGLLRTKKCIDSNIDIEYVAYFLNGLLPNLAIGDQNRRVTKEIIKNISIPIPIKENGDFDLKIQQCIVSRYKTLAHNKQKLIDLLNVLNDVQIKPDIKL